MSTKTNRAESIEGKDSVGMYLAEIARTPLLDAAREVELSKTIEAGLFARHLLETGRIVIDGPAGDLLERSDIRTAYLGLA